MKASFGGNTANSLGPQRIRVSKRTPDGISGVVIDEGAKKSLDLAEALQYERGLSQAYRQKNQRNIIKCHFLYNKLNALGNLEGVPEMIAAEVSEVDVRIKQLQQQLHFKRGQQMKKLKKKVANFLEQINFEVLPQDLDKIEDEIEIILFLMDVFEEKLNQMTAQRKEVDEILARLQESSVIKSEDPSKKESELLQKIGLLQAELDKLKNQDLKKLQMDINKRQSPSVPEQMLAAKIQEIQRANRKVKDLQGELNDIQARMQLVNNNLDRTKREEARWKERYRLMEAQKDQRIKMLEDSISKNMQK